MPHIYLAPYVGVGTDDDPFRPRGSEQPVWSAIDLRPDCAVLAGRALMSVLVRDDTIGAYLGDAPDEVSAAIKTAIQSRLGITLEATRLRQIIPELLIAHAREDGTRWRPLQAMRDGMFRIYLDGLWWQAKSLSGGTTITESFNKANSTTLGPDLSWTEVGGDLGVVSNTARMYTAGTAIGRADSDLATDDHYAQLVVTTLALGSGTFAYVGPLCRKDSTTALTFYTFRAVLTTTPDNYHELVKLVTGTTTTLGSADPTDFVAGEVVLVQADASAITGKINGVTSVGPITDTAITTNLRCGIFAGTPASSTGGFIGDSFEAGDLGASVVPVLMRHYRARKE